MINFTQEQKLKERIDRIGSRMVIAPTAGLQAHDVIPTIDKLRSSMRQKVRVSEFYLDIIRNMNIVPYLKRQLDSGISQPNPLVEPLASSTSGDFSVAITPKNNDAFLTVLCAIVDGFFASLISSSDSFAKIVNIIYNCVNSQRDCSLHKVREELIRRSPRGRLTLAIKRFHPRTNGSVFNIAKLVRNQLTHDIMDVIDFPSTIALYGPIPESNWRFHFNMRFFPPHTPRENGVRDFLQCSTRQSCRVHRQRL